LGVALLLVAVAASGQTRTKTRSTPARKPTAAAPKPVLGHHASRSADSRWVGEPISLDLKDADLRDVLHTFAEMTRLNIVVDPEVHGSVTVRLQDVPWDQALDLILRINGYAYVLEGNILRAGKPSNL